MVFAQITVFIAGALVVAFTLRSAILTFIVPRAAPERITSFVFRCVRLALRAWAKRAKTYDRRDAIMAVYAPVTLVTLPAVWFALVMLGYAAMFWALGIHPPYEAFRVSGSSLLTLGFAPTEEVITTILAFTEATIGLGLIALLIAYLPTMYNAFSRREAMVAALEVRAGSPPSAVRMLERAHRLHWLDHLGEQFSAWEVWFIEVEESHTSLAALVYFRSPSPDRSWITASGAVLDAAALMASTIDLPRNPTSELCIRAGYIALRRIADYFRIPYDPEPAPGDPISIERVEFDAVYDELVEVGLPIKPDRDQCWRDFSGWRVNYDTVLLALAHLTMAPYAPWSSDRSLRRQKRVLRHIR